MNKKFAFLILVIQWRASAQMAALSLTIVSLVTGSQAAAQDGPVYRFETTFQSAGNYHGTLFGASSDVVLNPTWKLLPRADNLTRSFDQGPTFNETTITLGAAHTLSKQSYLLGDVSTTPNAQIAPRYSANLDPHTTFGQNDIGFRVATASYVDQSAVILTPTYLYSFTDQLMLNEAVSMVRSDNWYVSSATQGIFKTNRKSLVRIVPAFGQTLESAGLPATFTSLAVEFSYDVFSRLRLSVGGAAYNSTLRHENSVLFRVEAR